MVKDDTFLDGMMVKLFFSCLLLSLLSMSTCVNGQSHYPLTQIPTCGLQCLLQTLPTSGCTIGDNHCICNNRDLAHASAPCVMSNCNMSEALTMGRLNAKTCELPSTNLGHHVANVVYVTAALCAISVFLRFATKLYFVRSALHWDDYILALCIAISGVSIWITYSLIASGFGQHLYELDLEQVRNTLRYFWLGSIMYGLNLGLVKLSVLSFYLRIFPYERFRLFTWAAVIFVILSTIVTISMCIFQCTPIAKFWNSDFEGKCIDIQAGAYSAAALAITSDFVTVLLPLPVVRKLNMSWRRKVGVMAMFGLGSAGCVIALVRLHSLIYYGDSLDPSVDFVPTTIYSSLEGGIPIITICFPQFRRLFSHFFPNAFKTIKSSSTPKEISASSKSGSGHSAPKYWFSDTAMGGNTTADGRNDSVAIGDLVLNDIGGILSEDEHDGEGWSTSAGTAGRVKDEEEGSDESGIDPRYPV